MIFILGIVFNIKLKIQKIIQLLSRAGGGIWPDEAQQPTVIPL